MTWILRRRPSNIFYKSIIFFVVGPKCIRNICMRENRLRSMNLTIINSKFQTYCILSGGICRRMADVEIRPTWIPRWLGIQASYARCPIGPDNLVNSVCTQSRSVLSCKYMFSIEFVDIYVCLTLIVGQKMNAGLFRAVRNHLRNVTIFNF